MHTMLDTTDDPRMTFPGLTVEALAAYANGRRANYDTARTEYPHTPELMPITQTLPPGWARRTAAAE